MNFKNVEKYRSRESIINDLKKDGRKVVIYGTGKFACSVAEFIIKNDISLYCFVDKTQYYYNGKTINVCGNEYKCILLNDMNLQQTEYNVLYGFIEYDKIEECRDIFKSCKYVDYLDVYPSHIIEYDYLKNNSVAFKELYSVLKDNESKMVLEAYLHARYSGDVGAISQLKHGNTMYDWELLDIKKDDILIDGGAYVGDTILEIKNQCGYLPEEIYAFEPDSSNLIQLINEFLPEELRKIHPIAAGLYKEDTILRFNEFGNLGSSISENGNCEIKAYALDGHEAFMNVSVIKMDIEGSELDALKGASKLIEKNKPKLAICIYHNNQDLLNVFNFLKPFGYDFFMRQHSCSCEETVLYAI